MKKLYLSILFIASLCSVFAQEQQEASAAQANNPLANMTALNFQNYYMPVLNEAPSEAYMNTTWIRYARPFSEGKLLLRISAPISTLALTNNSGLVSATNGLGDINAFLSYNFVSKPTATMGIGPLLAEPTASKDPSTLIRLNL